MPRLIRENGCSRVWYVIKLNGKCNFYQNQLTLQRAFYEAYASPGREQIRTWEPRGGSYTNLFFPIIARFLIAFFSY